MDVEEKIPLYGKQLFKCFEKINSTHLEKLSEKKKARSKTGFQLATVFECRLTRSASLAPNLIFVMSDAPVD